MKELTFINAALEAVTEEMERDPRVFAIGEDSGVSGGSFPIFKGIKDRFGEDRLLGTPIGEGACVSAALGAAVTGMRPIVGLHFADFMFRALDDILNEVAKARFTYGGQCTVPLVIRAFDGTIKSSGTQHSSSLEAFFAHTPGLKVVIPSMPRDAKGLLKTAIRDDDPVIYLEHKQLINTKGEVPEDEELIPFGQAKVQREGRDVTVIAYSLAVHKALEAARTLEEEGIDVEVVDLRTLVPLDFATIAESVAKTRRVVIAHEATVTGGFGGELAARIADELFELLEAPIKRVGHAYVPTPFAPTLEDTVILSADRIADAVRMSANAKVAARA